MGTFVRDRSSGDLYEWDGTSRLQGIENTSNDIFNDISISATQEDVTFPGCVLDGNFSNGSFKESIGVVDYDLDMYYGNVLAVSGDHNARLSLLGGSQLQWAQRAEDFSNTADGWHSVNLESVETFIFHSNLGGDINRLKLALWSYIATGGIIAALKIKFNEFNIKRYGLIDGIEEQSFYAYVKGRGFADSRTDAAYQIGSIMENDLGISNALNIAKTAQDDSGYPLTTYSFTISEKINTKKLIENIASTTPFIPRFDNMGDFKLDVIPKEVNETNDLEIIEKDDLISFSFSRTKIEDVYTKVVFNYNWDYERESFNSVKELDVIETLGIDDNGDCNYHPEYYGFDPITSEEYEHKDSTLVVDDDRGKYIRNSGTAELVARWLLLWHCNHHLKMKV